MRDRFNQFMYGRYGSDELSKLILGLCFVCLILNMFTGSRYLYLVAIALLVISYYTHSQVLIPIRRTGTSNMELGQGPCGGVEKKLANTLTNKGSSINVVWEILVPENKGNCTVKLSNGKQDEESFKILQPVEGKINEDGSFICGREKGFEHQEFILPEDYECDSCTLQWKWSTSYGDIYSCSDIIINGGSLTNCMGKCLNSGSCFNGKCICQKGFSGEFCEDKEGE